MDTVREITDSRRRERRSIIAVMLELFLADICRYEQIDPERAVQIWGHTLVSTGRRYR